MTVLFLSSLFIFLFFNKSPLNQLDSSQFTSCWWATGLLPIPQVTVWTGWKMMHHLGECYCNFSSSASQLDGLLRYLVQYQKRFFLYHKILRCLFFPPTQRCLVHVLPSCPGRRIISEHNHNMTLFILVLLSLNKYIFF